MVPADVAQTEAILTSHAGQIKIPAMPTATRTNKQSPIAATRATACYAHDLYAHAIDLNAGKIVKINRTIGGRATRANWNSLASESGESPRCGCACAAAKGFIFYNTA